MGKVLIAFALLAGAGAARAGQAVRVSVEDLARASDAVVRGRVVALDARWVEGGARIETVAELEPSAVWRGEARGRVRVLVPGGVVGDVGQRVSGAPAFASGEEVVVFLRRAGEDAYRVAGLAQGKYAVLDGVARPDLSRVSFVGARVGAGERPVEPIAIAELERRVRSVR